MRNSKRNIPDHARLPVDWLKEIDLDSGELFQLMERGENEFHAAVNVAKGAIAQAASDLSILGSYAEHENAAAQENDREVDQLAARNTAEAETLDGDGNQNTTHPTDRNNDAIYVCLASNTDREGLRLLSSRIRQDVIQSDLTTAQKAAILRRFRQYIQPHFHDPLSHLGNDGQDLANHLFTQLKQDILLGKNKLAGTIDRTRPFKVCELSFQGQKVSPLVAYCVLLRLSSDRLLSLNADGTFMVPPLDIDLLFQASFRRLGIELRAAFKIREKGAITLKKLYDLNQMFITHIAAETDLNNAMAAIQRDIDFHHQLLLAGDMGQSANEVMHDHYKMILWNCTIPEPDRRQAIHQEHERILHSIEHGRDDEVIEAYEDHFRFATLRGIKRHCTKEQVAVFEELWDSRTHFSRGVQVRP